MRIQGHPLRMHRAIPCTRWTGYLKCSTPSFYSIPFYSSPQRPLVSDSRWDLVRSLSCVLHFSATFFETSTPLFKNLCHAFQDLQYTSIHAFKSLLTLMKTPSRISRVRIHTAFGIFSRIRLESPWNSAPTRFGLNTTWGRSMCT